jgi:hypothetical protein
MTRDELIAKLQEIPENLPVYFMDYEFEFGHKVAEVSEACSEDNFYGDVEDSIENICRSDQWDEERYGASYKANCILLNGK